MSDWQVGDLAVCVDASPCRAADSLGVPFAIAEGSVWTVAWIGVANTGVAILRFVNEPPMTRPYKRGWAAARFRKIRPDEQQACEPEFIVLLNRSKVAA